MVMRKPEGLSDAEWTTFQNHILGCNRRTVPEADRFKIQGLKIRWRCDRREETASEASPPSKLQKSRSRRATTTRKKKTFQSPPTRKRPRKSSGSTHPTTKQLRAIGPEADEESDAMESEFSEVSETFDLEMGNSSGSDLEDSTRPDAEAMDQSPLQEDSTRPDAEAMDQSPLEKESPLPKASPRRPSLSKTAPLPKSKIDDDSPSHRMGQKGKERANILTANILTPSPAGSSDGVLWPAVNDSFGALHRPNSQPLSGPGMLAVVAAEGFMQNQIACLAESFDLAAVSLHS